MRLEAEERGVDGGAGAAGAGDKDGDEDVVDDQGEPENLPDVYRRGSREKRWS